MDGKNFSVGLGFLTQQEIQSVLETKCEAHSRFKVQEKGLTDQKNASDSRIAEIEIRGDYLIHVDYDPFTIKGGVKLNLNFRSEYIKIQGEDNFSTNFNCSSLRLFWVDRDNFQEKSITLKGIEKQKFDRFLRKISQKTLISGINDLLQRFNGVKIIRNIARGYIILAEDKITKRRRIIKAMKKNRLFPRQYEFLRGLQHQNICKAYGLFETSKTMYMVEQVLSFTLNDVLMKEKSLQLSRQEFMRKILSTLCFIHSKGIMHRDIKPENIMFRRKNGSDEPVMIDFGHAENIKAEHFNSYFCGTAGYISPEIMQHIPLPLTNKEKPGKYDQKCDIFSLGITFYELLLGQPVFKGYDRDTKLKNNQSFEINFESDKFNMLPLHLSKLLKGMLELNPHQRFSASQALDIFASPSMKE